MRLTASFQNKHRYANFSVIPGALQQAQDYAGYLDTQGIMDSWGDGLRGAEGVTDYLDWKQQHPLNAVENIQKLGKSFAAIPGQARQLIQDTWSAPTRTGPFVNTPYNLGYSMSRNIADGLANPGSALQNAPETLSRIPGRVMDVAGNLPGMQLAGKILDNSATVQGFKRAASARNAVELKQAEDLYAMGRWATDTVRDNADALSKNVGSGIHERMDGIGRGISDLMDNLKPMRDPALKMGRVMGPRVDPTQLNALPFYGPSSALGDIGRTAATGGELGLGVTLGARGLYPAIKQSMRNSSTSQG